MDSDINIDKMEIEDLREFTRSLLKLARVDADLIETMRSIIDLTEKKQGEV